MMKYRLLILAFVAVNSLFSQIESVSPIQWYSRGEKTSNQYLPSKALGGTFNGQFTYLLDTLGLPFFDDFARDKFQHYDAAVGDPNVVVEHYNRMLDMTDVPLPWGTKYTDVQTYHLQIDTTNHTVDSTLLLTAVTFKWNDLSVYPVGTYATETGYPPFNIYDTINYPNPVDTIWLQDFVYEQDTADMNVVTVSDAGALWIDSQAFRNFNRAVDPWSLGVVTFDGLDEKGYPYAINTLEVDYADALTSKAINLNYPPSDSIYFTFLYQPEGFGDIPEAEDSLILQFYNVTDAVWQNIWSVSGSGVADFKIVHIPIKHANFLQNGFKFRFRNYGGLSGDLDNWHIDYVHLRRLSNITDTEIEDFSIVYPIPSLLKDFSAVPWKHFRNSPTGHMNNALKVKLKNASNQVANSSDAADLTIFHSGGIQGSFSFPGGLISSPNPDYFNNTVYNPTLDLSTGYEFDATLTNDTLADFDYIFKATEPTLTELSYLNDSTFGTQHFANYYAYDDWSAEAGYGLTTAQSLLAMRFTPYQGDSLVGVQMNFVPTVNDQSTKLFLLTVWDDNSGQPGTVLYQDDYFYPRSPIYEDGRDKFHNYYFKDTQRIYVSGTFYVGWRQLDDGKLGIGFDYNTNSSSNTFISPYTGGPWINSSLSGTAMIRPVISSKMDYQLGIKENTPIENIVAEVNLYPNPVQSGFTVESNVKFDRMEIYSLEGRLVAHFEETPYGDLTSMQTGIYLVRLVSKDGKTIATKKVIKQ